MLLHSPGRASEGTQRKINAQTDVPDDERYTAAPANQGIEDQHQEAVRNEQRISSTHTSDRQVRTRRDLLEGEQEEALRLAGGGTGALVVCDDPQDFGRVGTRAGPSLPSLCILTEITHYSLDPPTASRLRRRGPAET